MDPLHETRARTALARHLAVPLDAVPLDAELDAGLGLDPLDLVLVALRFEEQQPGAEFPIALLAHVRTVRDLAAVLRSWDDVAGTSADDLHDAHARETVPTFDREAQLFFDAGFGLDDEEDVLPAEAAWWAAERRRRLRGWALAAVALSMAIVATAWSMPLLTS